MPCRSAWRVAASSLERLGWPSRQAPLAGALLPCRSVWRIAASSLECLGWPSRQAPLSGALSPELKYFVLEWLQGNHGGSWRSPGKPCRGVLQLPVHKFGVLGYPILVHRQEPPGLGQTRCRALLGQAQDRARAHADWATPNLAPYPPRSPITARVECGIVGEIVGGCLFGRPKRPLRPTL